MFGSIAMATMCIAEGVALGITLQRLGYVDKAKNGIAEFTGKLNKKLNSKIHESQYDSNHSLSVFK